MELGYLVSICKIFHHYKNIWWNALLFTTRRCLTLVFIFSGRFTIWRLRREERRLVLVRNSLESQDWISETPGQWSSQFPWRTCVVQTAVQWSERGRAECWWIIISNIFPPQSPYSSGRAWTKSSLHHHQGKFTDIVLAVLLNHHLFNYTFKTKVTRLTTPPASSIFCSSPTAQIIPICYNVFLEYWHIKISRV